MLSAAVTRAQCGLQALTSAIDGRNKALILWVAHQCVTVPLQISCGGINPGIVCALAMGVPIRSKAFSSPDDRP
jgi:hypothetical protein